MARLFLTRSDWPLVAAGILAGLVTAAVMIYLFVTGIGGSDPLSGDPDPATPAAAERRASRLEPRRPGEPGPVIGARESGIRERLEGIPVSARRLTGALDIRMGDVVWNDPSGVRFARLDAASGRLDLAAAERGNVILDGVVLRRPVVNLREDPAGTWNFEAVFAELLADDPAGRAGPARTIQLRGLRIENGDVEVVRPVQRFAIRNVQGQLPLVVLSQPGVPEPYLRAAQLSGRFVQAEPEADLAIRVNDGLFRFPDGTVRFQVADVVLDDTRFAALDGVWNPGQPGFGITATGRALGVDFADIAFLTPEGFPATGTATFLFAVRPVAPDDTEVTLTDLDAISDGSRVLGSFTAVIGEERFDLRTADLRLDPLTLALAEGFTGPLPYGGALTGTVRGTDGLITFDLAAALTAETVAQPFTVGLTGRVALEADGFTLQRLDLALDRTPLAALRVMAPALPVAGTATGLVSLSGPPGAAPLDVDVRLELGAGVALVEGTLDLTGAVPRYDLSGRVVGVDVQAVLEPEVPPVSLHASFSLVGSGFDPATMNADIRVAGRFSGWRSTAQDTLDVAASVRNGTLAVQNLDVVLATARLTARGDWRFVDPQAGAVAYDLDVTALDPFGPYLPAIGDADAAGALTASGSVSGTLQRLRLEGSAAGRQLRAGEWQAASLQAEYDVILGGDLPEARVVATMSGMTAPGAGAFTMGELTLFMTPPTLAFELSAQREDGGLVEVVASGMLPETGPRVVVVERARFDMAEDRWALVTPASIEWTADGLVDVDYLLLESERSEGRLFVSGRLLPWGAIDARVELAAIPVGEVQLMLGRPAVVEGLLWAEGTILGGRDEPQLNLVFRVEDGALQGVPLQRLDGELTYASNETHVHAIAETDTIGWLDLDVRLPSNLRLDEDFGFELLDGLPLSGVITANRFALAPLAAADPQVRNVTGFVDAQITLAGTADNPQVQGDFTLIDGGMRLVPLNQTYSEITGDIGFDGRRLVLRDLRARSDGWAVVGGQVVLERLDQPVLDLNVLFDGFRPMGVDGQRDAALYGEVAVTGPPDALTLSGAVRIEDGYVEMPAAGVSPVAAELADITRPLQLITPAEPGARDDWFANLAISNLRVSVGEGAWVIADQARAQLTGELVVNKVGPSIPITGSLEGSRGQYTLIAGPLIRRFDIVSVQVQFRGLPEPNPLIDITARRVVFDPGGRQLDVDVRITGSFENPQLALVGGEPGQIAESELLSFLIFGQPSFALAGEVLPGDALLEQTFVGGFAELAAIELERSLGGLGLDIFQVRLGTGAFGGLGAPTFILGRQLREDVFLTVETGVLALFGAEASAFNTWAARLDWTFVEQSRLRLAVEPVFRGRALRSAVLTLPLSPPQHQLLIEVRRRWTW
jgi:hypothetical protein